MSSCEKQDIEIIKMLTLIHILNLMYFGMTWIFHTVD